VDVALRYRKFDTTYMRHFQGEKFQGNDLPIMTLATDSITFPLEGGTQPANAESAVPAWERWNDYGIGLLRKGEGTPGKGQLRQAEEAFATVEGLGRPDGPLNRARVYIREGRLDEAVAALRLAASFEPPAPPWLVAWFTGLVNKQNGYLDEAIAAFESILEPTEETQRRGFDFSRDYRLLDELGLTVFERAKREPHGAGRDARLREAAAWFEKALVQDPENVTAHYGLAQVRGQLGETDAAQEHLELHAKYKPDDNARERAAAWARLHYPAANHAAEAVVIYDLQRAGAFGLPGPEKVANR
jgi:tetratricopeptide (TPR) repeat protein